MMDFVRTCRHNAAWLLLPYSEKVLAVRGWPSAMSRPSLEIPVAYFKSLPIFFLVVISSVAVQMARADDTPDQAAAREQAVAFAKALQACDMDKVHELSTGTDAEFAIVKTLGTASVSFHKFRDLAGKKYGDQAKAFDDLNDDMVADMKTADVKIDGDTASMMTKRAPEDKYPLLVKKSGSQWKVDLTNVDKDPDSAMILKLFPALTRVFDQMTKNLTDDKYKTFDEALKDYQQQCTTALTPAPAPDAPKQ